MGRVCLHPFCDRKLPIIADEMVDMSFGTGAVKITPAHDHNDYECGKRHNLPFVEMMTDEGYITDVAQDFKVREKERDGHCKFFMSTYFFSLSHVECSSNFPVYSCLFLYILVYLGYEKV